MEDFAIFFCLAITLHNIEEAIWFPKWSHGGLKFQKPVRTNDFHFALLIITALAYLSSLYYLILPHNNLLKWIFVGFLGSMIINAIVPHLIATIALRSYAPGLATGILLNIPINSFILQQMLQKKLLLWHELIISTVVVGIVLVLLIPILFKLGNKISPTQEKPGSNKTEPSR